MIGVMIGLPFGQGLGVIIAGNLQGKRGNSLLTLASAFAGDLFVGFLAVNAYRGLGGGEGESLFLDESVFLLAGAAMAAVPIATYAFSDYRLRFPLRPALGWDPARGSPRLGLRIAELRF